MDQRDLFTDETPKLSQEVQPPQPIEQANGKGQVELFDRGEWWEDEWQDMPEFEHEDLQSWKAIIVHFKERADLEAFALAIGQRLTVNTRSIWYPQADIIRYGRGS